MIHEGTDRKCDSIQAKKEKKNDKEKERLRWKLRYI